MDENKTENKQELVNREVIVNDDGSATLVDTIKYTAHMNARDFLSFSRNQEKAIEEIDKQISEDHIKYLETEKGKVLKQINDLKPYILDSEKKVIEINRQNEIKSKIAALESILSKPKAERNENYLMAILQNFKPGEYESVRSGLGSEAYRIEFINIMHSFRKHKTRSNKK